MARRASYGTGPWNYRYDLGANTDACEIKRYFNSFKYEAFPWLKNIHRDAHAQPFAALGKAWKAYFNGEVEGRPQFKKKGKCRDCFYVACDKFSSSGKTVRLPVLGQVKLREPLRFTGKIQSATVSREADRWFIAMAVEIPEKEVHPPSGEALGIDLGLTTLAVLSNGRKVEAPKPLGRGLQRLRRLSRAHSRKRRGSHNRQKAALRLARCHRRIANMRRVVPGHPRCWLVGVAQATGVLRWRPPRATLSDREFASRRGTVWRSACPYTRSRGRAGSGRRCPVSDQVLVGSSVRLPSARPFAVCCRQRRLVCRAESDWE